MNKRLFLVCVIVSLFGTTKAQIVDSIYLGEGGGYFYLERIYPIDTAQYGYPMYLFNEPHELLLPDPLNFNPNEVSPLMSNGVSPIPYAFLQEYNHNETSDGILYGIATTVLRPYTGYFTNPEAMKFVVAGRNTTNVIDVIASMSIDSYRVDKMFDYFVQNDDQYGSTHIYRYMTEYYFDHPIPLKDLPNPFLIGILMDSSITANNYYNLVCNPPVYTYSRCNGYMRWLFRNTPLHEWDTIPMQHIWGVFFPIVRPDSLLCGKAENFRVEECGDDYAVLAWHPSRPFQDLYSGRFQIALGGLGAQPDTTNILTFSDTVATITGLDSGVWYSAWVRGECCHCGGCPIHGDTLIWSPWRGPVQFYLSNTHPGTQGIATEDGEEVLFSLSPNPASGTVTVAWPKTLETVRSVELVDMAGQVMLTLSIPLPDTRSIMLDTSPLPSGVYLIRLYTPKTIVARKLTVLQQ